MSAPGFWFIVPLKAKAASSDWDVVCSNLRATLRSLLNQTDPNLSVVISCSDKPDLGDVNDPRVEIITGSYPVPTDYLGYSLDKRAKKRAAASLIRQRGGGYIMLADADDYVSNELVRYVRSDDNRRGYYVKTGYELYSRTNTLKLTSDFIRKCGTSYVCYFSPDELPDGDGEATFDKFTNHRHAVSTASQIGKPIVPFPFPAAIYKLETGENITRYHPNIMRFSRYKMAAWIKSVVRRLSPRRKVAPEMAREFALNA